MINPCRESERIRTPLSRAEVCPRILGETDTIPLYELVPETSSFVLVSEVYSGYWGHRTVLWRQINDDEIVRHRYCTGPIDLVLKAPPPWIEELNKTEPLLDGETESQRYIRLYERVEAQLQEFTRRRVDLAIVKIRPAINDSAIVDASEWRAVKEKAFSISCRWETHFGDDMIIRLIARADHHFLDSQLLPGTTQLPDDGRWLHESGLFELAEVADLPVVSIDDTSDLV